MPLTRVARSTLGDVARLAGVSVASVSRVLNGLPASSQMTARVRSAAEETGYVPDAVARSLRSGATMQLALVVADIGNPVYAAMTSAVESVTRCAGYRLLLSAAGSAPDEEIGILAGLSQGFVDGVIMSPLRVTADLVAALREFRIPTVVVGGVPASLEIDNVRVNSARGVGLAVRHLAETGRRSIGFINGSVDTVPGASRQRGFDNALRGLGLAAGTELRQEADDFTFSAGLRAAELMLDRATPDAIMCANDLLAVGTLAALRDREVSVPGDVAVVGMDDTELATMVVPALTSVDLGSVERGQRAAKLLLERLEDPGRPPKRLSVSPRLVVRASSVAPVPRGSR